MRDSKASSEDTPFALLGGMLLGFFLADLVIVIWRAPGLLHPSHWSGLGIILISALALYLVAAVFFAGFYLMVWIISGILRLRFSPRVIALIAAFGTPLFMVLQDNLQVRMFGIYMSMREPFFYVPTLITLAVLVVAMIIVKLIGRNVRCSPGWVRGILSWRGLIFVAFVAFFLYGTVKLSPINVLGVFTEEQQRLSRAEHPPAAQPAAEGSDFMVLKIEAFRSDEFTQENAPFLWELAHQNVWFTNYHVVSAATRPSVTSFFTSLYPAQHGCYNLALGQSKPGETPSATSAVAKTIRALPMLLQERGYHTIMTTSNPLTADFMFGFEKVYHRYDATEPYEFRPLSLDAFIGYRFLKNRLKGWRFDKLLAIPPDHSWLYFDAPRVNARIKQELMKRVTGEDTRPVFLFAHYMEPHTPYYMHPYRPVQLNLYSPRRCESILKAYRSEIQAVDRALADLYVFLQANGLLENMYLFITSDHGEEFCDHGDYGHGKSVYPEVIRVPGILVLPPGQRVSRRVDTIVESIDIIPTLAEFAGVDAPDHWEGESLAPLLVVEPVADTGQAPAGEADVAFVQFCDERLFYWSSAVTGEWQVVFREPRRLLTASPEERRQHRKVMIFNLADDPLAGKNLYGQGLEEEAQLVDLLDATLRRLEATAPLYQCGEGEIDPELRERLRALGYIN